MRLATTLSCWLTLLTVTVLAGEPPKTTVVFCDDENSDEKWPSCWQEEAVISTCTLIPDSNAKGDKGSYAAIWIDDPPRMCQMYAAENCDDKGKKSGWFGLSKVNTDKDAIYRAFKCEIVDHIMPSW